MKLRFFRARPLPLHAIGMAGSTVGAEYAVDAKTTLRGGVAYEVSPITVLERARKSAAVEEEILSGDVARMGRTQERAGRAELVRGA